MECFFELSEEEAYLCSGGGWIADTCIAVAGAAVGMAVGFAVAGPVGAAVGGKNGAAVGTIVGTVVGAGADALTTYILHKM